MKHATNLNSKKEIVDYIEAEAKDYGGIDSVMSMAMCTNHCLMMVYPISWRNQSQSSLDGWKIKYKGKTIKHIKVNQAELPLPIIHFYENDLSKT